MLPQPTLAPALRKLQLWQKFNDEDAQAVLALPHQVRTLRAHQYIVREQERPLECCVLLTGFAIRHKSTGNGDRQIFSVHLPGDFVDLHNSLLRRADHSIEVLTETAGAFIPIEAIKTLAFSRPLVGQAMWYETLIDASGFREWALNVGRRDALTRTAHMLCEFGLRLEAAGVGDRSSFELPMTQVELADALGLTAIHLNQAQNPAPRGADRPPPTGDQDRRFPAPGAAGRFRSALSPSAAEEPGRCLNRPG